MIRRLLVAPLAIILMPVVGIVLLCWVVYSAFHWIITGNNVMDNLLLESTIIDKILAPVDWAMR